jgi:hypothetical protein
MRGKGRRRKQRPRPTSNRRGEILLQQLRDLRPRRRSEKQQFARKPQRVAEEAAQLRLEEASRVQLEETARLLTRLQLAEQATIAAEERVANVSTELETIRAESAAAVRKATEEATGREESIRAEMAQSPGHSAQVAAAGGT